MTKAELLRQIESLSLAVRDKELSDHEIDAFSKSVQQLSEKLVTPSLADRRSLRELKGLGKELWRSTDVDEYIRQERDSWER